MIFIQEINLIYCELLGLAEDLAFPSLILTLSMFGC